MSEIRKVEYWDVEDQENLTHEEFDVAVESILDGMGALLPAKLSMCGYARMALSIPDILDNLLEDLDEEYSSPDGDPTKLTPAMREAADAFEVVIRQAYHVYACDIIERVEVDVAAWVKANCPYWLKEGVVIKEVYDE